MLGDGVDDTAAMDVSGVTDPTILQIHALAQQIGPLRAQLNAQLNNVSNADATVDWTVLSDTMEALGPLSAQFNAMVAAYNAANPTSGNPFDQAVSDMASFAQQIWGILQEAGATVSNIPQRFIDWLANIANHAEAPIKSMINYVFLLGVAAVGLLLFAEKSSGVRRAETAYIK